jgi:hypothetical protein
MKTSWGRGARLAIRRTMVVLAIVQWHLNKITLTLKAEDHLDILVELMFFSGAHDVGQTEELVRVIGSADPLSWRLEVQHRFLILHQNFHFSFLCRAGAPS